jgi:hypothetical protein
MTEHWRPIADFAGYVVSAEAVVWSVGRTVQTKGGATRTTAAKPLKPDAKGRVTLRRDGRNYRFSAAELAARHFPPTNHYAVERRVRLRCQWCSRHFDDFTTWWCENVSAMWPDLYRCPYCTTAVTHIADHFSTWH